MQLHTPPPTDFWTCLRAASPSDATDIAIIRSPAHREAFIRFKVPRTEGSHENGYHWGRPLFCRFSGASWAEFARIRSSDYSSKLFGHLGIDVHIRTSLLIKKMPKNVRFVLCYPHEHENLLVFEGECPEEQEMHRPKWMKHECSYCDREAFCVRATSAQAILDKAENKKRKAEDRAEKDARPKKRKDATADQVDDVLDDSGSDSDDYSGAQFDD